VQIISRRDAGTLASRHNAVYRFVRMNISDHIAAIGLLTEMLASVPPR